MPSAWSAAGNRAAIGVVSEALPHWLEAARHFPGVREADSRAGTARGYGCRVTRRGTAARRGLGGPTLVSMQPGTPRVPRRPARTEEALQRHPRRSEGPLGRKMAASGITTPRSDCYSPSTNASRAHCNTAAGSWVHPLGIEDGTPCGANSLSRRSTAALYAKEKNCPGQRSEEPLDAKLGGP